MSRCVCFIWSLLYIYQVFSLVRAAKEAEQPANQYHYLLHSPYAAPCHGYYGKGNVVTSHYFFHILQTLCTILLLAKMVNTEK